MLPCRGWAGWDTSGSSKGWCFTPPHLAPNGCSSSGDGGTGTGLEPCPGCSSPRPRMEVETAALVLEKLTFGFFPSCPPAPLPPAGPGQELPSCCRNPDEGHASNENAKQEMALCTPGRLLFLAGMRRIRGPSSGHLMWPGGVCGASGGSLPAPKP